MVDPVICGAAGGAISLWLRVFGPKGGILTTLSHQSQSVNAGGVGIFFVLDKLA